MPRPTPTPPAHAADSQARRRIKYGLNVTAAVAIAAMLVVLVNWIAYDKFGRWDFTATGRHSLSPQTLQILNQLEDDYTIVAMFQDSNRYLVDVRDLLEEYDRRSARVSVQHIDPNRDIVRRDQFYAQLKSHFADELEPLAAAVDEGMAGLERTNEAITALLPRLRQTLDNPELTDAVVRRDIADVAAAFGGDESKLGTLRETLRLALDAPLPAYGEVRSHLQTVFEELERALPNAVTRFERSVDRRNVPLSVQNDLLGYARELNQLRSQLGQWKRAVSDAPSAPRYDDVVLQLRSTQAIAVLGPDHVRVIPVEQMFRQPERVRVEQAGVPDLRFFGEERLTGTLVSMSFDEPPLVVFVATGQQNATGERGRMQYVAERLRRANFEVQQWNPSGQFTTMGQPAPARPAPAPRPGQRAVWVVLASPPINPNDPRSLMAGDNRAEVSDLISRRLEQGDGALLMLAANPAASFGPTDPISQLVETWGITPQLDRQLLREVQVDDRRTRPTSVMPVTSWPGDHDVTRAVAGLAGLFTQSSPLLLADEPPAGIQHTALVEIREDRLWAERDLGGFGTQELRYNEALSAEHFVVAVAAEREQTRLVVVADPIWAYDDITTITRAGTRGPQVDFEGAMYPGNSELFVNSVYWLAGLDEMIAASPRTQDIRRIKPISETTRRTTNWLLVVAMPVCVGLTGVGVWLVRRRN